MHNKSQERLPRPMWRTKQKSHLASSCRCNCPFSVGRPGGPGRDYVKNVDRVRESRSFLTLRSVVMQPISSIHLLPYSPPASYIKLSSKLPIASISRHLFFNETFTLTYLSRTSLRGPRKYNLVFLNKNNATRRMTYIFRII